MLPSNFDAEMALLGSVIIQDSIIEQMSSGEDDFFDEQNKFIFNIFMNMRELGLISNGQHIDIVIFKTYLQDIQCSEYVISEKVSYFIELIDTCSHHANWKIYDKIVKDTSDRRKVITECRKMEQMGINGGIDDISEHIKNITTNIGSTKTQGNTIEELANSFGEYIEAYKKRGGLGYEGPYKIIDQCVGGIIPGKVYTIAAYSGTGKSNFSYTYVTDALKKGKKVIFFSLEVQKEMLFANLLKSYYGKTQKEISSDYFEYELGDFENLKVFDTLYDLKEICATVKLENPDLIFIDFIQNIRTPGASEYEKMTSVAQELQQLAITTNTTVFSISQANNDSRFKEGGKIQPKGSGAIFASSDIIFGLHRDGKNLKLNLIKNKYGPSDKNFLVIPDFQRLQFKLTQEIGDEVGPQTGDYFL